MILDTVEYKKKEMKTPEEFAKQKNAKLFFDIEMSLNNWHLINQWVKDYAEYYHQEMEKKDPACKCSASIYKESVL